MAGIERSPQPWHAFRALVLLHLSPRVAFPLSCHFLLKSSPGRRHPKVVPSSSACVTADPVFAYSPQRYPSPLAAFVKDITKYDRLYIVKADLPWLRSAYSATVVASTTSFQYLMYSMMTMGPGAILVPGCAWRE
jgi:hypothetical protein